MTSPELLSLPFAASVVIACHHSGKTLEVDSSAEPLTSPHRRAMHLQYFIWHLGLMHAKAVLSFLSW